MKGEGAWRPGGCRGGCEVRGDPTWHEGVRLVLSSAIHAKELAQLRVDQTAASSRGPVPKHFLAVSPGLVTSRLNSFIPSGTEGG